MCTVDDLDNLLLIHKSQLLLRFQFKVPADQFQLDLAKEFYIISWEAVFKQRYVANRESYPFTKELHNLT